MASYPTLPQTHSLRPRNPSRSVDVSDAGTVRLVDLAAADVYDITLTHPWIDSTERDTLLAFYASEKTSAGITVELSGVTYTCAFASPPEEDRHNAAWWTFQVRLVGTA